MERDFLGLSSKEPLAVVKEEIISDGCKDTVFPVSLCNPEEKKKKENREGGRGERERTKKSVSSTLSYDFSLYFSYLLFTNLLYHKGEEGVQWQFSNKVSALSHLMSFKIAQEDKTKKIVSDPLISSGFMNISTSDAFDTSKKRSMGEIQMFSVSNQAISVSVGNPFFKNHFAPGQNLVGTTVKQPLLGGIPVTAPHTVIPTISCLAGTAEPWIGVKAPGSPAQLTLFYAGAVHVYDDITPEKAQAIMLLAGNLSSVSLNNAHPKAQVQAPTSKLAAGDVPVNQPINTQPCSGLSSPISVSSHTGTQSGSGSTSNDELMAAKANGVPHTVSKVEPQKISNVVGSVAVTPMFPSAVPQARKASLARFLEKRKERAMNAAPYNHIKKSSECTTQECDGANFASPASISLSQQGE